jgi:hypothetical protein
MNKPPNMSNSSAGPAASVVLLVDARQRRNRFGRYAAEILLAEGLPDFEVLELTSLDLEAPQSLAQLRRYGVVVLTCCGAVPGLDELLAAYVHNGGRLILVQPPVELTPLTGLEPLYSAKSGTGVLVDSRSTTFGGFPYEPIQVIGALDLYFVPSDQEPARRDGGPYGQDYTAATAAAAEITGVGSTGSAGSAGGTPEQKSDGRRDGVTVLARVVDGDWPVERYPAIVERVQGQGRVLSFLYDLPYTVARLRQGDPALAGNDTDGLIGIRPSDAIQWQIDPRAAHMPQAEIHQALFARAVETLCPWPLPRLWYLPGEAQSLLVLTGDLCNDRNDDWLMQEAALAEQHGGALSFYLNEATHFAPQLAAQLAEHGHTLSIHPFAMPFSAPHMDTTLGRHLSKFGEQYGVRPRTVRHHRLQWLGWAEQARLEARHGFEMDLNFTTARPVRNGYLFGAGRPIRFVDEDGSLIPVWQQPTQFEDDLILGDHEISLRVETPEACAMYDSLLDDAVRFWHSVIAVNLHPGNYMRYSGDWGRHLVARTASLGVPIWNSERWLSFTAARAALCVTRPVAGDGAGRWQLTVPAGASAGADVTLLVPGRFGGGELRGIAEANAGEGARVGESFEIYGRRYWGVALRSEARRVEVVFE